MAYIGAGITRFNTADELTVTGDAQIDGTTLVVDSTNNNVGIGTASPDGSSFSGSSSPVVNISGTRPLLILSETDSNTKNAWVALSGDEFFLGGTNTSTRFYTANAEAMRIDSSQRVGIGTSSPNGNGLLTINTPTNNSPQIVFSENDTGKWLIGHRHDGDHFRFYDLANSAERLRIDSNGNVGIGTNDPQSLTHFKGTSSGQNILHLDNSAGSGHGDTNNNVRVVAGNNNYWANLVIAAHSLEFKVQGGSTGITAESDGDLSIADGNLVVASGHGINFAATSDASGMTSELLDDYEEGTFSPIFQQGISVTSYSAQNGRYTKVGRLVTAEIDLDVNVGSVNTNHLYIGGLPFTSLSSAPYGVGAISYNGGWYNASFTFLVLANTTFLAAYRQSDGGAVGGNDLTDFDATIRVTAIYMAA